jgi:hypothetical protein
MPNLNLQIMLALHLDTKKIIEDNQTLTKLYYSLYATNIHYHINYHSLAKNLEYNRCEKFFIFEIIPSLPWNNEKNNLINFNYSNYHPISKNNPYYLLTRISTSEFFKTNLIENCLYNKDEKFNNEPIYKNAVFIFQSIPLPFIIVLFRIINYKLSQGSNSHRGLLSTPHLKLAQFITCLEGMNKTTVFDSYHNYNKFAIQPFFDQNKFKDVQQAIKSMKLFYDELEERLKIKQREENIGIILN